MFKMPRSLGLFEKTLRNWIMAAERAWLEGHHAGADGTVAVAGGECPAAT